MEIIFVIHIRTIMDTMATGTMGLLCSSCPVPTYLGHQELHMKNLRPPNLTIEMKVHFFTGTLDYLLYPLYAFGDIHDIFSTFL